MKNLNSEQDYQKALEKGRSAMLREPFATHARFNSRTHLLSVDFSNGTVVGVALVAPGMKNPLIGPWRIASG